MNFTECLSLFSNRVTVTKLLKPIFLIPRNYTYYTFFAYCNPQKFTITIDFCFTESVDDVYLW